jgi:predicted MFS family arabinose efflux permease
MPAVPNVPVALLSCAAGLSVANVYYPQPLLDLMAADLAITQGLVGAVVTMTQAGSILALLFLVPLGDRLDRRRLLLAQLLALVGALGWAALAPSAGLLLTGMLGVGLLGTATTQGLIAYAATVASPEERGRVVGAVQGGVVAGLLLSRVCAGTLADVAGWRGVYGTAALAMLALAFLLWRRLPPQRAPVRRPAYADLIVSMFVLMRREPVLRVRGMIALLMFMAFSMFWSAMVLPLGGPPHGFTHSEIGAFGLVGVAGVLGAARAGAWADQGRADQVSGIALVLLCVSWLPLRYTSLSIASLVLGILLLDLAVQALQVTNQSMILRGDPAAHGRLVACYMLFYAVGSGLGAILATSLYAWAGWNGVCLAGATVSLAALLFWALTRERVQRPAGRARCQSLP